MKQGLPWLIAVGCLGLAVGMFVKGGGQGSAVIATQAGVQRPGVSGAIPTGNVIYTFKSSDQVHAFATIWQERQNMIVRMALLQGYWNGEKKLVTQLNEQLNEKYSLEPDGNYKLNNEDKILVRVELPTDEDREQEGAEPREAETVYTFDDDAAMQVFTNMWQQRQGINIRMHVLESYWSSEQAVLTQANQQLAELYGIDINKNYFLDSERQVLIETETPPPPAPSAEIPDARNAVTEGESPDQSS